MRSLSLLLAHASGSSVTLEQIVRSQYPEFSICNLQEWMYPALFLAICIYCIWLVWSRIQSRQKLKDEASEAAVEEQLAEVYTQALKEHARRCALYLQLLDLIVIADPLNRGERYKIQQSFRAAIKSVPAELSEEYMPSSKSEVPNAITAAQRWADICWDTHIVHATQSLSHSMWRQHVVYGNYGDSDSKIEAWRKEAEASEEREEREVCTAAILLGRKCDLHDDWPDFADLVRAAGVQFSPNDIRKMADGEDGIFEDFVPHLVKRAYEAGHTLLLPDGDDDSLMFVRISDFSAVDKLLRALYPKQPDAGNVSCGYYGGNRLMKEGESYFFPGKTIEEGEQEAEENMRLFKAQNASWSYWIWDLCGGELLNAFAKALVIGFLLLCCLGVIVWLLKWACSQSTYPAWFLAASFDCVLVPSVVVIPALAAFYIVHVAVITPILNRIFNTQPLLGKSQREWNPGHVPLPDELRQL